MCFEMCFWLVFGSFPTALNLDFDALAYTRLQLSHFRVFGKVTQQVSILASFLLHFCFKNRSKNEMFFEAIFDGVLSSLLEVLGLSFGTLFPSKNAST